MTDDEKKLDRCSKQSALAVLGVASVASVTFFGGVTLFPFAALPLWALGMLQRVTREALAVRGCSGLGGGAGVLSPRGRGCGAGAGGVLRAALVDLQAAARTGEEVRCRQAGRGTQVKGVKWPSMT
jgi:hypothetical protein